MGRHEKAKLTPIRIHSINSDKDLKLNDLEAALLAFQKLIDEKVNTGKKGIILNKKSASEYKMSYKKLQSLLWELDTFFALRGAFSFGICADCKSFHNSCYSYGVMGKCNGSDKTVFDSCDKFVGDAGFGRLGE